MSKVTEQVASELGPRPLTHGLVFRLLQRSREEHPRARSPAPSPISPRPSGISLWGRISRHMRSRFKALISLSSLAPVKRSGSNGPFVLPASSQTKGGFVLPRSPAHCPPEPCSRCQPPHPSPPTSQADRLRFRSGPLSGTSPTFDLLCGSGKSVLSVPEKLPAARGHGPTPAPQLLSPSARGKRHGGRGPTLSRWHTCPHNAGKVDRLCLSEVLVMVAGAGRWTR